MGTLDQLLGRLDLDPNRRGDEWERIVKWYLGRDPIYRDLLRRVWRWADWPGRWGGDAGIDLVAEDHEGRLWAIQAKCYDPAYSVTKADVDTFLSESSRVIFGFRLLVATTDRLGTTARRTIEAQEKPVSVLMLGDLRTAPIEWPRSPGDLRARKPPKKKLWPHSQEAVRRVVKGFDTAARGQLVMACGTGKTLIALHIAERLDATRTLVLVPSLSLLAQTLREWTANADFDWLAVCSDDTVADRDAPVSSTSDLGYPVTTDPAEVARFLRARSGRRVVFATYQSSPRIAAAFALGRVPGFDLTIADEAHRCAGPVSSDFATVLDPDAIRSRRRLFMTATPRYFTGRVRREAAEADWEVASMDDEATFGPVLHRLSFADAIERDLLTDYRVVVVGVDDATYRGWAERGRFVTIDGQEVTDARTLAGQIGLAKAMRRYDLSRVITFHWRVKRAADFARSLPEVIAWMPTQQRPRGRLWAAHASGAMPAGQRSALLDHLRRLDDEERGLLANARCLAEGVDVPTLDGVAFIDPRRSEVDIVQAVGRAIRKADNKKVGTIVIPVFIDATDDPEAALDQSVFKPVWDVMKALRAHDEVLAEQLDALRRDLGRGATKVKLPDRLHVDLPAHVGTDFALAFDTRLVEETTASWDFWYGLLRQYVEREGTAIVPTRHSESGFKLGQWVASQRSLYQAGRLLPERAALLSDVPGWTWDVADEKWLRAFHLLTDYVEREGDALVPTFHVENGFKLGVWVTNQRTLR